MPITRAPRTTASCTAALPTVPEAPLISPVPARLTPSWSSARVAASTAAGNGAAAAKSSDGGMRASPKCHAVLSSTELGCLHELLRSRWRGDALARSGRRCRSWRPLLPSACPRGWINFQHRSRDCGRQGRDHDRPHLRWTVRARCSALQRQHDERYAVRPGVARLRSLQPPQADCRHDRIGHRTARGAVASAKRLYLSEGSPHLAFHVHRVLPRSKSSFKLLIEAVTGNHRHHRARDRGFDPHRVLLSARKTPINTKR